ncbi:MAG: HAD hydrolase-like protein, partial [Sporomusa sp.]
MDCFVFDIDGTLIDSEYGHMEGLRRVLLERCGQDYRYDDLQKLFGMPGRDTMKVLGIDDPNDFIKRWNEVATELNKGKMHMFD